MRFDQAGPVCRAPGAVKGVLRRLEAVLALLPGLFAVGGRVPSGSLIPLLQALAQGLTVARLDMLHVQAAGNPPHPPPPPPRTPHPVPQSPPSRHTSCSLDRNSY